MRSDFTLYLKVLFASSLYTRKMRKLCFFRKSKQLQNLNFYKMQTFAFLFNSKVYIFSKSKLKNHFQMLKTIARQVLSVQNGDDVLNIKHNYTEVYTVEDGSSSRLHIKFNNLVEVLECLHLWKDIIKNESEKPKNLHS